MCGRFTTDLDPGNLTAILPGLDVSPDLPPPTRFNVAPSQVIAAVTMENGSPTLCAFRWGLVPSWAKDAAIGNKLINARSETAAEKPSFRSAFKARRCIVPASGFYEWGDVKGYGKAPVWFSRNDGKPMAFAGLWESWNDRESGEDLCTATILTTQASADVEPVHGRMPVILDPADWERWLAEPDASLLRPLADEKLSRRPVSSFGEDPRRDRPETFDAQQIELF